MPTQIALLPLVEAAFGYVLKGKVPPTSLVAALASKVLGYLVIAGACINKVPQILTVSKARSAEGLSPISFELETIGFAVHSAYGYLLNLPFNVYGEGVSMLLQNLVLLALIYRYAKVPLSRALAVMLLLGGGGFAVFQGLITTEAIQTAYAVNNVMMMAARAPQIWSNYRAKSTGQLNMVGYAMNTLGCVARIFTSIQEGAGAEMVRGFVLGLALNATIVLQILYYGNKSMSSAKKKAV